MLEAENEEHLRKLSQKLTVPHILITEVDPPYHGQATAIGIEPVSDRAALRKQLSSLPLFGKLKRE